MPTSPPHPNSDRAARGASYRALMAIVDDMRQWAMVAAREHDGLIAAAEDLLLAGRASDPEGAAATATAEFVAIVDTLRDRWPDRGLRSERLLVCLCKAFAGCRPSPGLPAVRAPSPKSVAS